MGDPGLFVGAVNGVDHSSSQSVPSQVSGRFRADFVMDNIHYKSIKK
jgi:hypothetical protein